MTNTSQQDLVTLEGKLIERQEKLEKKQEDIAKLQEQVEKKREEYVEKLSKISGLTREEATKQVLAEAEKSASQMLAKIIKEKEEEAKRTSDKRSQEIVLDSMKHGACARLSLVDGGSESVWRYSSALLVR